MRRKELGDAHAHPRPARRPRIRDPRRMTSVWEAPRATFRPSGGYEVELPPSPLSATVCGVAQWRARRAVRLDPPTRSGARLCSRVIKTH